MHFKRHKPKNARAGCTFCKPHKANGVSHARRYPRVWGDRRRDYIFEHIAGIEYDGQRIIYNDEFLDDDDDIGCGCYVSATSHLFFGDSLIANTSYTVVCLVCFECIEAVSAIDPAMAFAKRVGGVTAARKLLAERRPEPLTASLQELARWAA